jgi:hypothetical protein
MEWGRKNIKNKKKDLVNSIDHLFKSLWVNSIDFFHYFFSMAEIALFMVSLKLSLLTFSET